MGITKDLAHYITGARFEDLSPNVVGLAKQLLLDELGCAFGGLSTNEVKLFIDYAKDVGGKPEATIIGDGSKVPAANAAGVNAFAANTLDFDETYRNYSHPASMSVLSAIAMSERQGASGKDVINAIVTAYEIVTRIGDAVRATPEMQPRNENFSYKSFGPMAAAATILGLNEDQVCDAIGITGYTAPMVNLNLWMKGSKSSPIKGALYWQCQTGIEAALLAQRGFMGPPNILDEKEWGYWAGVSDQCDWDIYTYKLGEEYYLEKYLSFKPWTTCRWNHPGIDMILEILQEDNIDPMDVEEIIYKQHYSLVSKPIFHITMPTTDFEAMYSTPWAFAPMMLGYKPGPDFFSKERQDDPRVRELIKRVRVEEDPEITRLHEEDPEKSIAKVMVKVKGKVYERQTEYAKGDLQKPMTLQETEGKFSNMANRIIGDEQAGRIIGIVNNLEKVDNLRELTREFIK
ncbi:MmgE/PrpD family protein [Chloroflexota bacterium]